MMEWNAWPGKSNVPPSGEEHPAILHMIDVASVAEVLIDSCSFSVPLKNALIILTGLHDLGKISESFRDMLRKGIPQPGFRHWQLSEALFYSMDDVLAAYLNGRPRVRQQLYAAVAGHHGCPPDHAFGGLPLDSRLPPDLRGALRYVGDGKNVARQVIEIFCEFWPAASLDGLSLHEAKKLSWWLSGFCTAADWIASNPRWFGVYYDTQDLPVYLKKSRDIAKRAVAEVGIAEAAVRDLSLFDFSLRPMQAACSEVALPDGPLLAVVEDETGAGKTEAALLLAHRMMLEGKGKGLFFALPTMATADAMFSRASDIVGRMLENPSVTLAHGRSGLSDKFRDLVQGSLTGSSGKDITSSEWLAESSRRALLANIGIGTIDQALLSVLPVRFQTLRHYGLSSKILIVDEVHEMGEPYIAEELIALLKMHRAAGGSAILATATLPLALREKLLAVYDGVSDEKAYPALTIAGGQSVTKFSTDDRPVKGPVIIERLSSEADAVKLIASKAASGAACVWIRNAVDDAIKAVELLKVSGIDAQLLHARFALWDRKKKEADILDRVGKNGRDRKGFVLVGTQVLESSLDLDFDVMVSDIAPVAALIQRAGRLWRHMDIRPSDCRPVQSPVLYILSPDPDKIENEQWLQSVLGKGAWVYSLADIWRTARTLFSCGKIGILSQQRDLIEAVYGPDSECVPSVLEHAELKAIGHSHSSRALAHHNIVDLEKGYRDGGRGDDDVQYPTRPGEESRVLCLARKTPQGLTPWAEGDAQYAWSLSEVAARRRWLDALILPDQSDPEILTITKDWPEWKRRQIKLCPVNEDGSICPGLCYQAEYGLMFSSLPEQR